MAGVDRRRSGGSHRSGQRASTGIRARAVLVVARCAARKSDGQLFGRRKRLQVGDWLARQFRAGDGGIDPTGSAADDNRPDDAIRRRLLLCEPAHAGPGPPGKLADADPRPGCQYPVARRACARGGPGGAGGAGDRPATVVRPADRRDPTAVRPAWTGPDAGDVRGRDPTRIPGRVAGVPAAELAAREYESAAASATPAFGRG